MTAVVIAGLLLTACTAPATREDAQGVRSAAQGEGSAPRTAQGDRDDGPVAGTGTPPPAPTSTTTPSPAPSYADAAIILRDDDGFTDSVLAALEAFDGVARVGGSRNGEVALWRSTASDDSAVDRFADGFRVPVTARIDEAGLPGPRLAPGQVLLTPAGSSLRDGLDVGGTLTVGPDRTTLTVAAVADDQAPYGTAELVLHPDDADATGLEPLDRLFLLLGEGVDVEAVADEARALLDTDEPRAVEVRELVPGRGRRTLSVTATKQLFGEFAFRDLEGTRDIDQEQAWVDANVTVASVPLLGEVRCHRAVLADLRAALEAVVAAGLSDWADPSRLGGCWYPRRISEQGNLSKHAWGIAIDVNVDFSVPGGGEVPPDAVIEAFRANGFSWGGDFPTPDNHHFEWVGDDA